MTKKEVAQLLEAKGVRINIGGCGCCGSPNVSIEIDGNLLVEDKEEYTIYMMGKYKDEDWWDK